MTTPIVETTPKQHQWLRSTGAVVAGILVIVLLSTATDRLLEALGVFPTGKPMGATSLFLLAIAYRDAYAVLGGYLTARLAPSSPVRHAIILGVIGVVANAGGVAATLSRPDLGPVWYPVVLLLTSVPFCWLGGTLYRAK
jgi:hypothetical protein